MHPRKFFEISVSCKALLETSVAKKSRNTVPYLRINCSIIIFLLPSNVVVIVTFTVITLDPGLTSCFVKCARKVETGQKTSRKYRHWKLLEYLLRGPRGLSK